MPEGPDPGDLALFALVSLLALGMFFAGFMIGRGAATPPRPS